LLVINWQKAKLVQSKT